MFLLAFVHFNRAERKTIFPPWAFSVSSKFHLNFPVCPFLSYFKASPASTSFTTWWSRVADQTIFEFKTSGVSSIRSEHLWCIICPFLSPSGCLHVLQRVFILFYQPQHKSKKGDANLNVGLSFTNTSSPRQPYHQLPYASIHPPVSMPPSFLSSSFKITHF